jgi:hypothetical protein
MDAFAALEQCGQVQKAPKRVRLARRVPPMASLSASYTRDGAIQIYDLAGRKAVKVSEIVPTTTCVSLPRVC